MKYREALTRFPGQKKTGPVSAHGGSVSRPIGLQFCMLTIAELPEYIRIADKLLQGLNGKMSSATWLNIPKLAT